MILISDSGSTKTDWVLLEGDAVLLRVKTQGLNPTQQKCEDIAEDYFHIYSPICCFWLHHNER